MFKYFSALIIFCATTAWGNPSEWSDYLVRVTPEFKSSFLQMTHNMNGENSVEDLQFKDWLRLQIPAEYVDSLEFQALADHPGIIHIQPNYRISLFANPGLHTAAYRAFQQKWRTQQPQNWLPQMWEETLARMTDNPEFPRGGSGGSGPDPLFNKQWGMRDIGVQKGWRDTKGSQQMTVAVIDTGVDYTHEDLVDNLWRNAGEIGTDSNGQDRSTNGIDDDGNGFIDDVVGWDFAANDNKPFDLSKSGFELFQGGNPGHGTHCAGNVAARADNGKGVVGVAPNVKIMVLRFLTEDGQGTTADAIKSIKYAVDNGAQVLSNSWGSEGEDPKDESGNQALKDAIQYTQDNNRLFVAAAGNGHQGVGYDNDNDSRPAYPASYDHDTIVSVAALDVNDNLGSFSNWGLRTVDIGAPGVKVFSTTVGSQYADTIFDKFGITITWDGTSMATPHVAGAADLYWSLHPNASYSEVKEALLSRTEEISTLRGKVSSHGKLNIESLMNN